MADSYDFDPYSSGIDSWEEEFVDDDIYDQPTVFLGGDDHVDSAAIDFVKANIFDVIDMNALADLYTHSNPGFKHMVRRKISSAMNKADVRKHLDRFLTSLLSNTEQLIMGNRNRSYLANPGITADDVDTVEYLGIFLTPRSKRKLAELVPPKFNQKSGDHLTILHGPTEEELEDFLPMIGKHVILTVTHEVADDRVQAVRVRDIWTARGAPHITLSWQAGASPAESNDLVASQRGQMIQPWIQLQGIYDVYPRSLED